MGRTQHKTRRNPANALENITDSQIKYCRYILIALKVIFFHSAFSASQGPRHSPVGGSSFRKAKGERPISVTTSTKTDVSRLRVTKKLSPTRRGAIKLASQFGESLVCVRHRTDAQGLYRYTTVELLVETTKINPRVDADDGVQLRIALYEKSLRTIVLAAGAVCDSKTGLWHISRRMARTLKLTDRIVET